MTEPTATIPELHAFLGWRGHCGQTTGVQCGRGGKCRCGEEIKAEMADDEGDAA